MRLLVLFLITIPSLAFSPGAALWKRPSSSSNLKMSDTETTEVPIEITGNNIDLTPALVAYVNEKMERPLGRLQSKGVIVDCEVHLSVNKNPKVKNSHRVEVTTNVKGTRLRSTRESPDMYASIDEAADRLTRKLKRYKERRLDGYHGGKHMGDDLQSALEDLEEEEEAVEEQVFDDPEAPQITKIKSFDLGSSISIEEAIFALDYIDHDFYVFRDKETNEISVVYKRNAGGIGLIQPQQ